MGGLLLALCVVHPSRTSAHHHAKYRAKILEENYLPELSPAAERFQEPVVFNEAQKEASEQFRCEARDLGISFDCFLKRSREKSLALTALEEALMWANKALATHGAQD
jgi:hypothetical protein